MKKIELVRNQNLINSWHSLPIEVNTSMVCLNRMMLLFCWSLRITVHKLCLTGVCKPCSESTRCHLEKEQRPISLCTPLTSAAKPSLIREVRALRLQLKERGAELEYIQRNINGNSVSVPNDIKVTTGIIQQLLAAFSSHFTKKPLIW